MSYKPIDLQTSLPRVTEIAPIAHREQQRQPSEQAMLGAQAVKKAETNARRKTQAEAATKSGIKDRERSGHDGRGESGREQEREHTGEQTPGVPPHPFKGRHIDFSG